MFSKKFIVIISILVLVLACIRMIYPSLNVDWITIALIAIAIIPWLAPLIKSIELPGVFKVEFKDLKSAAEKIIGKIEFVKKAIPKRGKRKKLKPEKKIKRIDDIYTFTKIAESDSNLAIVALRIEIEKRIHRLAEKYHLEFMQNRSLRGVLRDLYNAQILPADTIAGLEELIIIGNKAAHGATVSSQAAALAINVGPRVIRVLDDMLKDK